MGEEEVTRGLNDFVAVQCVEVTALNSQFAVSDLGVELRNCPVGTVAVSKSAVEIELSRVVTERVRIGTIGTVDEVRVVSPAPFTALT